MKAEPSTAVLISSLFLRENGLGQIDIAYISKKTYQKWQINLVECKTAHYPNRNQTIRLKKTQEYLSKLLDMESKSEVSFCQKDDHSLFF